MSHILPLNTVSVQDDATARAEALDRHRSFIVQAPAGSGKTELLIQRYLALLSIVSRPEHILAMTFTRKAAEEMRHRIIGALTRARENTPVTTPHEETTRQLAIAVLKQDQRYQWSLIDHPSCLRVSTFDAFCAEIARQTPLLNRWGAAPITEDADQTLHRWTAMIRESLYEGGSEEIAAWRVLLLAFDNQVPEITENLTDLLKCRDQWLSLFLPFKDTPENLKKISEAAIGAHIEKILNTIFSRLAPYITQEVRAAFLFASENIKDQTRSDTLIRCAQKPEGLPDAQFSTLREWQKLASYLLTSSGSPRKRFTVNEGFPADHKTAKLHKETMMSFTAIIDDKTAKTLDRLRALFPSDLENDPSWTLIGSVFELLPKIYARYCYSCAKNGVIDFTETQLQALSALSSDSEGSPSDLLLKLDQRIDHILIDEFQDTSITQAQLLETLVSGWQPNDGRTFFAVGDPMQSIYRFRQAEVGVYLQTQETRSFRNIIPLTPLTLKKNFRSQANLVIACNAIFSRAFPKENQLDVSAVKFEESTPTRSMKEDTAELHLFSNTREEAAFCAEAILRAQNEVGGSIAVLVRQKSHLSEIIPALRARAIAYTAVEIDPLTGYPVINDLLTLTRTLIQPDDDIAWLSLLRAPYCGLTLADIVALSQIRSTLPSATKTRWRELLLSDKLNTISLSESGKRRLLFVLNQWRQARLKVGRTRLSLPVSDLWHELRAPSFFDADADRLAADTFFEMLDTAYTQNTYHDWQTLVSLFENRYLPVAEHESNDSSVQLMTLHKSKGLEFNTVIIPRLDGKTKSDPSRLLRWKQIEVSHDHARSPETLPHGLMLAAKLPKLNQDQPSLEKYIKSLHDEENHHEALRLLYVGLTRARERLVLTGSLKIDNTKDSHTWRNPQKNSLLAFLQPPLTELERYPSPPEVLEPEENPQSADAPPHVFVRFSDEAFGDIQAISAPDKESLPHQKRPLFSLEPHALMARYVGTLVHDCLSRVGIAGGELISNWNPAYFEKKRAYFAKRLMAMGIPRYLMNAALHRTLTALESIADDPHARFIFDPENTHAENEWAINVIHQETKTQSLRIDRTFVRQGVRYIIDYKITEPDGAKNPENAINSWLQHEIDEYRLQLSRYVFALQQREARPIIAMLYFPLIGKLVEVNHES